MWRRGVAQTAFSQRIPRSAYPRLQHSQPVGLLLICRRSSLYLGRLSGLLMKARTRGCLNAFTPLRARMQTRTQQPVRHIFHWSFNSIAALHVMYEFQDRSSAVLLTSISNETAASRRLECRSLQKFFSFVSRGPTVTIMEATWNGSFQRVFSKLSFSDGGIYSHDSRCSSVRFVHIKTIESS